MIRASSVSVAVGRTPILHDVDFTAHPGQVTAIIGPNGSGKSTLLRAVAGEIGYGGRIAINGRDVSATRPWEAALHRAVLPQATVLSFPFTVREVVRLGTLGGRSGASAAEQALLPERALAAVDLDGFGGRFYQELSGGEQQRVQLARVLCQVWKPVLEGMPRFLLLDEPVSNLDIKHQLVIMRIARDFARAGGGVVAILHDLNLAAMFADHVCLVHRGTMAASGRPDEVMQDALLGRAFDCALRVGVTPASAQPFVLPHSAVELS
jgi:iron complex transport system ATP-binding protein